MSPREIVALSHYLTTDLTSRTLSDATHEIAFADIARGLVLPASCLSSPAVRFCCRSRRSSSPDWQ